MTTDNIKTIREELERHINDYGGPVMRDALVALSALEAEHARLVEELETLRNRIATMTSDEEAYRENERARREHDDRSRPDDLRLQGWAVATHNDYRQDGQTHTFWLVAKDGRCIKGEGRTDMEALDDCRFQIDMLSPAPPAQPEKCWTKCCRCGKAMPLACVCKGEIDHASGTYYCVACLCLEEDLPKPEVLDAAALPVLHLAFAEADEVVGGLGVWCGSEGKALSTTDKGRVTCAKCLRMMATRKPAPKKPYLSLDPATLRWCARVCAGSARHWREGDATIATKELASDFRGMASHIERERSKT
jgi:hypothetical protein